MRGTRACTRRCARARRAWRRGRPAPSSAAPTGSWRSRGGSPRGVVELVAAVAAVALGVAEARQPGRGELCEHVVGEPARPLPLVGVRAQLARDEAPDGLAQLV